MVFMMTFRSRKYLILVVGHSDPRGIFRSAYNKTVKSIKDNLNREPQGDILIKNSIENVTFRHYIRIVE